MSILKCLTVLMLQYICSAMCFDTIKEEYNYEGNNYSTTCTVLNQGTVVDPGQITNYVVDNILKSPVSATYDTVESSKYTMQASQTMARPISSARQPNISAFSDITYITRNSIMSLTDNNNTLWKSSTYSITFKVSGCIDNSINAECRWTAPLACAPIYVSYMPSMYSTMATKFPENQQLYCFPIMLEWKTKASNGRITDISRIKEMSTKFGTFDLENYVGSESISMNAASVVGDFARTTSVTVRKSGNKKVNVKVVPHIAQCSTLQLTQPIETQNLGEAQILCLATEGFTIAYASNVGYLEIPSDFASELEITDCKVIDAYVTFSTYTPNVIPVMYMVYPPRIANTVINGPHDLNAGWRGLYRLQVGADYVQELAQLGNPSVTAAYTISLFTACTQSCGSDVYSGDPTKGLSNVILCDPYCYVAYVIGYKNRQNVNAICDVHADKEGVLSQVIFDQLLAIATANNANYSVNYDIINPYCGKFATMFSQTGAKASIITYITDSLQADNISTTNPIVVSVNPEFLNHGVSDPRLCTEFADTNSGIAVSLGGFSANPQQAGILTGFGCASTPGNVPNDTLASSLLSLTTRSYTDMLPENTNIMSSSAFVSQWLLLAQNVVLSVIASIGLLSLGELASRLDSLLYTIVYYYYYMAKRVTSVNVAILTLLWTIVLSMVIITNAASAANVAVTIIRLRNEVEYTAYRTEQVQTSTGAILVESVQRGRSGAKIWPGYVIAGLYSLAILLIIVRIIYIMFSVNWKKRVEWLHDSSYSRHNSRIIIHNV